MIKLFGNRLDYLHEKFVINEKRKQDKLAKYNKIHKEGFDAGYKKGYKKGMEEVVKVIKKHKQFADDRIYKRTTEYDAQDWCWYGEREALNDVLKSINK